MSLDKLKQTLSELQKNNTPTQTVWVEVKVQIPVILTT